MNTGTAKGELKAHVDTPDGQEQEVFMQEMDRDLFAIRFLPKENGVYYITVKVRFYKMLTVSKITIRLWLRSVESIRLGFLPMEGSVCYITETCLNFQTNQCLALFASLLIAIRSY